LFSGRKTDKDAPVNRVVKKKKKKNRQRDRTHEGVAEAESEEEGDLKSA